MSNQNTDNYIAVCAECNTPLIANWGDDEVTIEPCPYCKNTARQEGLDECEKHQSKNPL